MLHMRTNAARGTVRHRSHQVYVKMACELAVFLEHNPGEVDVVRLSSDRWTEDHKVMMKALTEGVRIFLRQRGHLLFEQLLHDFQECQPCAVSGTLQASLLYGQEQYTSTTTVS